MGYASYRSSYNGGVVNSVSEYRKRWLLKTTGSEYPDNNDSEVIQKLLTEYHTEGTTPERKKELKHDILMRCYFMFPSFLRKNYHLPAELFNDAVQNMAANTLRAIELFNPNLGYQFSNYLVGWFRDGAVSALRSVYIVSAATLRQAAIDAALPAEDEDIEKDVSPFLAGNIVVGNDAPEETSDTSAGMYADQGDPKDALSSDSSNCMDTCDDDEESLWCSVNGYTDDCKSRVMRGANVVRGNVVELDDSRYYKLAPGTEKNEDIDDQIHQSQLVEWLEEALDKESGVLTDEERFIIIHHYGLFGTKPMIYSEIAEIRKQKGKGCACSRISQINSSAIRKLRKFFEENKVERCPT